ncbi:MAG TPA: class I SAM-dependent methyltransferase [Vicinamibacterales bacterium]|nr:class I SAM-dependent methyltransferase [Vicinamibacterales bacterium]
METCQGCNAGPLEPILFLGYLPPVNAMPLVGSRPTEQPSYPAQLLRCSRCELVQLGLIVDPAILFPPEYPYTSGTTKILRDNFAQLATEVHAELDLERTALVVDIGSNDGTLLSNFASAGHRVRGIEPTDTARLAEARGVPTLQAFFGPAATRAVIDCDGRAGLITAANVFAHMEAIHGVIDSIVELLAPEGVFVSESHYWISLLETLQYDTIYHEHLRYYSLTSLRNLLASHGLEVFRARRIPTHGGSIRVYAARRGSRAVHPAVQEILRHESTAQDSAALERFKKEVVSSKLDLLAILRDLRARGDRIFGIGAPSRATTLITYVGLDATILECVCEIAGSHKIGRYVPGTLIPVLDEQALFDQQPEHALLFSWHIAEELIPKLRARGYRGDFIVPLPQARVA